MQAGDAVIFHGGWGANAFTMRGVITGQGFISDRGHFFEELYGVELESGSHHYGYAEQFEPAL